MFKKLLLVAPVVACLFSCRTSHDINVNPIEIKPIYIKVEIDIKLQKEFEDLFSFEKKGSTPEKKPESGDKK